MGQPGFQSGMAPVRRIGPEPTPWFFVGEDFDGKVLCDEKWVADVAVVGEDKIERGPGLEYDEVTALRARDTCPHYERCLDRAIQEFANTFTCAWEGEECPYFAAHRHRSEEEENDE